MNYPKIVQVGHREFALPTAATVDIEEKVDGSQISFGVRGREAFVHSKSAVVDLAKPGMFAKAAEWVIQACDAELLRDGYTYSGEYLQKPRHNALAYDRVPDKHIVLFDVKHPNGDFLDFDTKAAEAACIGLEIVPLLYCGPWKPGILEGLLEIKSMLGGQKIEGVVIKPHDRLVIGKYVSPQFKELHTGKKHTPRAPREAIVDSLVNELATAARWQKAVIHLKERDQLTDTKRDIGPLLKEAGKDMHDECKEHVKDRLFAWAWPQISKAALRQLPTWYEEQLCGPVAQGLEQVAHND